MKKGITAVLCAVIVLVGGCDAPSEPGNDLRITDGSKMKSTQDIENLVSEYVYRVYDIVPEAYTERYIDETTSYEDMMGMIYAHSVYCSIEAVIVSNIEFENASAANAVAIMTAQYSSDSIEGGNYYIPMRVDCVYIDDEWKVSSSEWLCFAPTDEYILRKNDSSGYYELYPIEGGDNSIN